MVENPRILDNTPLHVNRSSQISPFPFQLHINGFL